MSLRHPRTLREVLILLTLVVLGGLSIITFAFVVRYSVAVNNLSRGIGQTMFSGFFGREFNRRTDQVPTSGCDIERNQVRMLLSDGG